MIWKGWRWFLGLVILCSILIWGGTTKRGKSAQLRVATIFSPLSRWVSFIFNEFKIRHENKALQSRLAELALENQILRSLQEENKKLSELLGFKETMPHKLILARVIGRDPNLFSGVCIIDKGTADGVEEGAPVITPAGVYGKIVELTSNNAVVQTISNFNFRAAAMNLRNGIQGIVRWEGGKGFILGQVQVNSDIVLGDSIVTSGIGSVFPKGLLLGEVREIKVDETKLFFEIGLEPACKLGEVEWVFVMQKPTASPEPRLMYKSEAWEIERRYIVEQESASINKSIGIAGAPPPRPWRRSEEEFPVEFKAKEPTIRISP